MLKAGCMPTLMFYLFFVSLVFSYPSYLDDPQDCYVPDPTLSCASSTSCKNKGGSSNCFYAMGRCMVSDGGTSLQVDGVTVSNHGEVQTSFGSGQVTVEILGTSG